MNKSQKLFVHSRITRALACGLAAMLVVIATVHRVEAASGDLDAHFGNGGFVTTDLDYDDQGGPVVLQSDGRIVLGVHSQPFDEVGNSDSILMRYNTDGT